MGKTSAATKCFANICTVKEGDILSTGRGANQWGLVHSIIHDGSHPIALEMLPIQALAKGEIPSDETLKMIPQNIARISKLPEFHTKNYWVSLSLFTYTPDHEPFIAFTAFGSTRFSKNLSLEIIDQKIAALHSTKAQDQNRPSYTKPPTHVAEAKKPIGARILDIYLDDIADIGLCTKDAPFVTILKNASITRLKTAFSLASSPTDADRLHQIYEATKDTTITFEQFHMNIKSAWKKFSSLIQSQAPHINHDKFWFNSDEKLTFQFAQREANISIDAAQTCTYIKGKYLPDILKTIGISFLGEAFIAANETPDKFRRALKKIAPDMSPTPIIEDIIHGWEAFQMDTITRPFELLADPIEIFYPKREVS